jgi:hypothetical protein
VRDWWRRRREPALPGSVPDDAGAPERAPAGCRSNAIGIIATIVIGGAAALEVRPAAQNLLTLPSLDENRGWIDWLRQNTDPQDVIACAPFPIGYAVEDYQDTAYWMYWAMFHRRTMMNGYSGFFPEPYLGLKTKMEKFPDDASIRELWVLGTKHVVLHRRNIDRRAWRRLVLKYPGRLQRVFWDPNLEIGIYALTDDPAAVSGSDSSRESTENANPD